MSVKVKGNVNTKESQAYIDYIEKKYNRKLESIEISLDGDYVDLNYEFVPMGMERIRRITGYLVGTMDNWNDAKSAEEKDRVKHSLAAKLEEIA